ncbi:MAG: (2Fe-2S)-binding protein [Planctomycetes bacterium]|nr:(2Fe-2S)-binding protein [Planctomycetota bacterium]MCB9934180.1 (2Fe-2S)-binding protein [Planctomycetota bacterium]
MSWDFRQPGTRICVCYDVSNDDALKLWRESAQPSVDQLKDKHGCGNNCAMCIPYFRTLLREYQRGKWPKGEATNADAAWFGVKKK